MTCNFQIAALMFSAPCFAFFRPFLNRIMKPAFLALMQIYVVVFNFFHNFVLILTNSPLKGTGNLFPFEMYISPFVTSKTKL